jgi:cytochrome P450
LYVNRRSITSEQKQQEIMPVTTLVGPLPDNLSPDLVFDFDMYLDDLISEDPHEGLLELRRKAPGIFWTPRNGGHWCVMDRRAIETILRTPKLFSNRTTSIPKKANEPFFIPVTLDPPESLLYRRLLMTYFEPASIAHLEKRIVEWTRKFIESVKDQGGCEFVSSVAEPLPISVFMEFVGFPSDKFEEFRDLAKGFYDAQGINRISQLEEVLGRISNEMSKLIEAKQKDPRDDVVTKLILTDYQGRKLTVDELKSICMLFFLAGLDTVTNALIFGVRHLAKDKALRNHLAANPDQIPKAAEEMLRRYTFTIVTRLITEDIDLGGAPLKAGDMVAVMLPFVGLDSELNPEPLDVKLDRNNLTHYAFGMGGHICLGRHLAKLELRTFYKMWLEAVPEFELDATKPTARTRGGKVIAYPQTWLRWNV